MFIDIPYSLELLKKINSIKIDGLNVYDFFRDNDVSFWSIHQYQLFQEVKKFSRTKDFQKFSKEKKTKFAYKIIDFVLYLVVLLNLILFTLKLIIIKPKVLIYSVDKLHPRKNVDPRLMGLYQFLQKNKVRYIEVIHAKFGIEFLKNIFKRKRPILYIETILFLYKFWGDKGLNLLNNILKKVDTDQFSNEERSFILYILKKYANACLLSQFKIRILKFFLSKSSIEFVFSVDDPRYSGELIWAAKKSGIKTFVFQHSNFDYLFGIDTLPPKRYIFPDKFFVWNHYWLERLKVLSPLFKFYERNLEIGGRANGIKVSDFLSSKNKKKDFIFVLIPYEINVDKKAIYEYILEILKCPEMKVIFKTRNDMPENKQIEEYHLNYLIKEKGDKVNVKSFLEEDDLNKVDVVLGVYSTFLDEMIERGRPVGVLNISYPIFNNLSESGLADLISKDKGNICNQIKSIANTSLDVLEKRRSYFIQGMGNIDLTLNRIFR